MARDPALIHIGATMSNAAANRAVADATTTPPDPRERDEDIDAVLKQIVDEDAHMKKKRKRATKDDVTDLAKKPGGDDAVNNRWAVLGDWRSSRPKEAAVEVEQPSEDKHTIVVRTLTLQPGVLACQFNTESGEINKLMPGGYAFKAGIREGWRFLTLDSQPFSETLVRAKTVGGRPYEVTFASWELVKQAKSGQAAPSKAPVNEPDLGASVDDAFAALRTKIAGLEKKVG